jgi:GAF domain-containing protein
MVASTSPAPDDVPEQSTRSSSPDAAPMQPQDAFTELARIVIGSQPLGQVLARVGELAKACIPGVEEVSVTLQEGDSKAYTAAFTGSLAVHLDERQYEAGFGPCMDAAQSGQTIRIDDTSDNRTYPDFARAAARQGVRSTVSVGMPLPQRIVGGLNVYKRDANPLDDDAVQLLQVFAGYAATALANHALYASSVAVSAHLQTAMQSRAVIEQAKGMLMARLHCSAEDAFAHLATQSQHANRKLRDIAAEVVANP